MGAQHPPAARLPAGSLPAVAWGPQGVPKEPARSAGSRCGAPAPLHAGAVPPAGAPSRKAIFGSSHPAGALPASWQCPRSCQLPGLAAGAAGRVSATHGAGAAGGSVRLHGMGTAASRPQGARCCGTTAIRPPCSRPAVPEDAPGLPAPMARDLLVPRLQLFLTTFPSCSRASIVLPPTQLSPPRHVPPAPPDLQLALGAARSPTGCHAVPHHIPLPQATPSGLPGPAATTARSGQAGDLDTSKSRINPFCSQKPWQQGFATLWQQSCPGGHR